MSFEDKAQESASERFFLVKFTPRRYLRLAAQFLAPQSYGFYVPENLNINTVSINGRSLSPSAYSYAEDSLIIESPTITAPSMVVGEWYVIKSVGTTNFTLYGSPTNNVGQSFECLKEALGTGTVYQDLSLDLFDGPANIVTLDHDIYVTGTKIRETKSIAGLPDAFWEPLILNYPSFSQSMRNIVDGVFTLSNSQIELISTDRWAQYLVGLDDREQLAGQEESLSNCPISVWICIDSESNNRKIFDGEIVSFSYKYGVVSLQIIDTFQKLGNTASFGSRRQSEVYTGNNIFGITASPNPDTENKNISITMGKSSPYAVSIGYKHVDAFDDVPCNLYHLSSGQDCILLKQATQQDTTYWLAGRSVSPIKLLNFGTIYPGSNTKIYTFKKNAFGMRTYNDGSANDGKTEPVTKQVINRVAFVRLSNINDFNGEIGDIIPPGVLTSLDGNEYGGVICAYGNNLLPGEDYNLAINILYQAGVEWVRSVPIPDIDTKPAIVLNNYVFPSLSVWVEADDNATYEIDEIVDGPSLSYIKDRFNFTTRYLPYSSISSSIIYDIAGKQICNIIFTLPPNSKIDLSTAKVKCRFSPVNSMSHGEALKFVCKAAGMSTNDATFAQADVDLSANVSLTLPMKGGDFPTYLEIAQAITTSTLGILRVNNDRQIEYELIKSPESLTVDGTRDAINMIEGQTDTSVNYQDICSEIVFQNPQLKNLSSLTNTGPNAVVSFEKVKQLHRIDRSKTVNHVLESIQNRKDAIAGYLSNPTVEYNLATASVDLVSSIGDVIEINNRAVAGVSQTTKGVIIALDQAGSTTKVKINEIRGVD
jgi:hypothetical protein